MSFKKWANKTFGNVKRNISNVIKDPFDIEGHAKDNWDMWGQAVGINDVTGRRKKEKDALLRAQVEENARTKASLLKVAEGTTQTEIDKQTRGEMFSLLKDNKVGAAADLYKRAAKGTDNIFIARVRDEKMYEQQVDQPGAAQTRIDGFSQAAMQLVGRR
jgi:hypothetical protein